MRRLVLPASSRFQQQRDDEKSEDGGQGNEEHHAEDGDSEIYFPVDALLQSLFVQDLTRFECEEEERSVVGDGRDVVWIGLGESPGIVAGDEIGERVRCRESKAGKAARDWEGRRGVIERLVLPRV